MARGDMLVSKVVVNGDHEILNRKEFQATPMTINTAGVDVKAGTPIDKDGNPVKAAPWTGAIGILLYDVTNASPTGAILKHGYVHVTRAQSISGLTYDGALAKALVMAGCGIVFEEPVVIATA